MFLLLLSLLLQDDPVDLLIQKLGSDSIEEREEATGRLTDLAECAEPALAKAALSRDPETASRARVILEKIHPYRLRVTREVLHLLSHATEAFENGRYDRTLVFCDEMLRIDPRFGLARQLREETLRTILSDDHREAVLRRLKTWNTPSKSDPSRVPAVFDFRLPPRTSWVALADQIRKDVGERVGPCDPEEWSPLLGKLEMKLDLAFDQTPLEDILAFIRDFSGLNLVLDAAIEERVDPAKRMTLHAKDQSLGRILNRLLSDIGLTYTVAEGDVLLLTTPTKAGSRRWVDRSPVNLDERDPDRY